MHRFTLLVGVVVMATLHAMSCSSDSSGRPYVLVTLKAGDRANEKTPEERSEIQAAHLANIRRLADEGTLVVAGPYGKENHDPTSRGIFIFDVATLDEANALTGTDPAVIAGVLAMQAERLRTDADFRASIEADRRLDAEARREGRERAMGEGMRTYVLIRAKDRSRSREALHRLLPPNTIIVDATVGANEGLYIVDGPDRATVRGWLGKLFDDVGPCTLDEWYGTATLVQAAARPSS